jgi:hypothetical protein
VETQVAETQGAQEIHNDEEVDVEQPLERTWLLQTDGLAVVISSPQN